MKKILWFMPLMILLVISAVSAASLSRTGPASVSPGQSFTVTYATSNAPSGKWFVAWSDSVSGGCTPTAYNNFMAQESGGDSSATKTFIAPQSGSCIFSGYYQFTGGSQVTMPGMTVSVTTSSSGDNSGTGTNTGDTTQSEICGFLDGFNWIKLSNSCTGGALTIVIGIIALVILLSIIKR